MRAFATLQQRVFRRQHCCLSAGRRRAAAAMVSLQRSAAGGRECGARAAATSVPAASPAAAAGTAGAAESSTSQPPQSQQQQQRTRPAQGQLVEQCMVQSPAPLIDIGINLVDRSFDKDREAVMERATRAGLEALVVTGTCVRTSQVAAALCGSRAGQASPQLFFTAGVHCHNAKGCNDVTIEELRHLAAYERCVAIGECGLDFNRNFSPPAVQERWFAAQIDLAEELGMPLFLHCRDAGRRFAEIYRKHHRSVPGVVHCFTGSREELEQFLELGLYIGITGWVCDDRPERGGAALASLLPLIPADRLFIETDAPYLTPRTIPGPSKARPHRNEPALLPYVLQAVAAARREAPEQTARMTTANARRFFRLPVGAQQ